MFFGTIKEPSTNDPRFLWKSFTRQNLQDAGSKRVLIGSFHAIKHMDRQVSYIALPPERDRFLRKFVVSGPKNQSLVMGGRYPIFHHGLRPRVGAMQLSERTLPVPFSQRFLAMVPMNIKMIHIRKNELRKIPKVFGLDGEISKSRRSIFRGTMSFQQISEHKNPLHWVQDASRELVVYARHFTERLRNTPEAVGNLTPKNTL